MTIYQKAIKVKKICESLKECTGEKECPYFNQCTIKKLKRFIPEKLKIETLAEAIQKEKWKVK